MDRLVGLHPDTPGVRFSNFVRRFGIIGDALVVHGLADRPVCETLRRCRRGRA